MKVSYRRFYLNAMLSATEFYGRVLDIGGQKINKQGKFSPLLSRVESWEFLNIDAETDPDYHCSAESIPVGDGHFDIILLIEVLEHLERPEVVLKEISRVLKRDGKVIASMPFLTPLHGCPHDFQRWSPDKISMEFTKAGLRIEKIEPMGGIASVILDLISKHARKSGFPAFGSAARIIRGMLFPLVVFFDKRARRPDRITTGYFITARASDS